MEGVSRPAHIYFHPSCPALFFFFSLNLKFPFLCTIISVFLSSGLLASPCHQLILSAWSADSVGTAAAQHTDGPGQGRGAEGPGGAQGLAQRCSPHLPGLHLSHLATTPLRI